MRRSSRILKRTLEDKEECDEPTRNLPDVPQLQHHESNEKLSKSKSESDSSSDSDIENYLKRPEDIDFNSTFFKVVHQKNPEQHRNVELVDNVEKVSDNNVGKESARKDDVNTTVFENLYNYNKILEEAKRQIDNYKEHVKQESVKMDVTELLEKHEMKNDAENDFHATGLSSDYETLSEKEEDFEEVEEAVVPTKSIEVVIKAPENTRKKKGYDLMGEIRRRINRVRKQNQVYIHKVSLLCWLAHGLFINRILNNESILSLALSLLPSQHSYPSGRTDLKYLESIMKWYRMAIKLVTEPVTDTSQSIESTLQEQIGKRQAVGNKNFVYIFICVLRSLGINTRLVISLQALPLVSASNELFEKTDKKNDNSKNVARKKSASPIKSEDEIFQKHIKQKDVNKHNRGGGKHDAEKPTKGKNGAPGKRARQEIENKESSNKKESPSFDDKKVEGTVSVEVQKKKSITMDGKRVSKTQNGEKSSAQKTNRKSARVKNDKNNINDVKNQNEATTSKSTPNQLEKIKRRSQRVSKHKELTVKCNTDFKIDINESDTNRSKCAQHEENEIVRKSSTKIRKKAKTSDDHNGHEEFKIPQVDGADDSDSNFETQDDDLDPKVKKLKLDTDRPEMTSKTVSKNIANENTDEKNIKPNIKKLKRVVENVCPVKRHHRRLTTVPQYEEADSDDDFHGFNSRASTSRKSLPAPKKQVTFKDGSPVKWNANAKVADNLKHKPNLKSLTSKKTEGSDTCIGDIKKCSVNLSKLKSSKLVKKESAELSPKQSKCNKDTLPKAVVDIRDDIIQLINKNVLTKETSGKKAKIRPSRDSDGDYEPPVSRKHHGDFNENVKVKRRIPMKKNLHEIEEQKKRKKVEEKSQKGVNVWLEVFLEEEDKWIPVDIIIGQIHCAKELYSRATHPVSYILAWDNGNHLKDITQKYCINWNTVTRKLRVDPQWWTTSLKPFIGPTTARDKNEDEDISKQQLEQPLPTTISEYKNHPLYALKRHLLKFQAIYPPNALTLGFVRNEPVYSRHCVHTLHSREIWLKEAKVVKPGEKPYKIVKARPKYDRLSNSIVTDLPLEIFGIWQVGDYVPPTAENGVVPRNAYGNVELFKDCMLPKGTVHLRLPNLNKVARKLNIDCAPAVIGFDFHSGWSHPTFDGFVVCTEYEDVLVAAWHVEQEEAEKRAQDKIDKRVYDNWRKLIKGLLIRERLKSKYNFGESSKSSSHVRLKKKSKKSAILPKKRQIVSTDESD